MGCGFSSRKNNDDDRDDEGDERKAGEKACKELASATDNKGWFETVGATVFPVFDLRFQHA